MKASAEIWRVAAADHAANGSQFQAFCKKKGKKELEIQGEPATLRFALHEIANSAKASMRAI